MECLIKPDYEDIEIKEETSPTGFSLEYAEQHTLIQPKSEPMPETSDLKHTYQIKIENINISEDNHSAKCTKIQKLETPVSTPDTSETFSEGKEHQSVHAAQQSFPAIRDQTSGTERKFSCEICEKEVSKRTLQRHLLMHAGEKPFSCNVCAKSFTGRGDLNRHMRIHNGERPFTCDVCMKAFTQRNNLTKHLLTHTTLPKPFVCDICKKDFAEKSKLASHILIHNGEKRYSCDICKKGFYHKNTLKRHLLTHTFEKPVICYDSEKVFSCVVCSKSFYVRFRLRRHMLEIHTGKRPLSCNICKKRYSQGDQLERHMLIHTSETILV